MHELARIAREAVALAGRDDLARRLARGRAFAARDDEPELALHAAQAFFERAADGRRYAGRMPVEAENAAERLKPVGVGNADKQLARALVLDDQPDDFASEPDHALEEPGRRFAAVERQVGDSGLAHL